MKLLNEGFCPITITLETSHEARALATILNWSAELWDDDKVPESGPVLVVDDDSSIEEIEGVSMELYRLLEDAGVPTYKTNFVVSE